MVHVVPPAVCVHRPSYLFSLFEKLPTYVRSLFPLLKKVHKPASVFLASGCANDILILLLHGVSLVMSLVCGGGWSAPAYFNLFFQKAGGRAMSETVVDETVMDRFCVCVCVCW